MSQTGENQIQIPWIRGSTYDHHNGTYQVSLSERGIESFYRRADAIDDLFITPGSIAIVELNPDDVVETLELVKRLKLSDGYRRNVVVVTGEEPNVSGSDVFGQLLDLGVPLGIWIEDH